MHASVRPPSRPPPRGPLRWLRLASQDVLLLAILLLLALWWASGREGSLAWALRQARDWLPAGQHLVVQDVTGTLRHGGHIGQLQWQGPGLRVQLSDLHLAWHPGALLQRRLHIARLAAAEVVVQTWPGEASGKEDGRPPAPPTDLWLPLGVHLSLAVQRLRWVQEGQGQGQGEGRGEGRALELHALRGSHVFDGHQHQLALALSQQQNHWQGSVRLQARAPLEVQAEVQGELRLDGGMDGRMAARLHAEATGYLAGADAALTLGLRLAGEQGIANMSAGLQARLHPWRAQPLDSARVQLQQINLAALRGIWPAALPAMPVTQMDGKLELVSKSKKETEKQNISTSFFDLRMQIQNSIPGPWDAQRLPLQAAEAHVHYDADRWRWQDVRLDTGPGEHLRTDGRYHPGSGVLEAQAQWTLRPGQLHGQLAALPGQRGSGRVHGTLGGRLDFSLEGQALDAPAAPLLDAHGYWQHGQPGLPGGQHGQPPQLALERLEIRAARAQLSASQLHWDGHRLQAGHIEARVPGVDVQLQGRIPLDGAAVGQGSARARVASLAPLRQWLEQDLAPLLDTLAADSGRALHQLAQQLAPWQLEGTQLAVDWRGGWGGLQQRFLGGRPQAELDGLHLRAELDLPALQYGSGAQALRLADLRLQWRGTPAQGELAAQARAQWRGQRLHLDTRGRAGLDHAPDAAAQDWHIRLDALQARWQPPGARPHWTLQLDATRPGHPLHIGSRRAGRIHTLGPGRLRLATSGSAGAASLQWEATQLDTSGPLPEVSGSGQITGFPLAWGAALTAALEADAGPKAPAAGDAPGDSPSDSLDSPGDSLGDVQLSARWRVDSAGADEATCGPRAEFTLERTGGDLPLPGPDDGEQKPRAGLDRARLEARLHCGEVQTALDWHSQRAGRVEAALRSRIERTPSGGWHWPQQAALDGRVTASVPALGVLGRFAPPGWRLGGRVQMQATIAGTQAQPDWQGQLHADDVSLRSSLEGIALEDGRLRATFQGTRLRVDELRLHGAPGGTAHIAGPSGNLRRPPAGGGELHGSGELLWQPPQDGARRKGGQFSARGQLQAHRLQLLARADRQLSLSGSLRSRLDGGQWALEGELTVDRASIITPDASAPALDGDVLVLPAEPPPSRENNQKNAPATLPGPPQRSAWLMPKMRLVLDLGPDFALQGHGLTTRLAGTLDIATDPQWADAPRVGGEIRTQQGRYRAWGQMLDVQSGLLRFNGPADNPALDILALRPGIPVRAGVRIQGTARAPRVLLHAEPPMADAEILSWMLTGRDPAAGGAASALLQQAAIALLGGRGDGGSQMAARFGLDEIGFRAGGDGADSEEGAGPAVSLGKRLSQDLYVTWEQSLGSAMGTLYLFYDLGRNLTLRAQGGLVSALDIIYTLRRH